MKHIMIVLAAIACSFPACKDSPAGGDGGEDAEVEQAELDVEPDEDMDAEEDEEDVGEPDAAEDVPEDEEAGEEIPPSCADQAVECGMRTNGMVAEGPEENLDKYFVHGRPIELDESGGEVVFAFQADGSYRVDAEIADYSEGNLDVIVLDDSCRADSAIAFGDANASFRTVEGSLYYVVVDGRDGTSGAFELVLECSETFEDCGNGEDDDGDGDADCDDRECRELPPCYELFCDDGEDDDGDGDVDCDDFECLGAEACTGGPGEIADPCDSHADCSTGQCYMETETGWPGGYCIQISYVKHCDEMECPDGSYCEPMGFTSVTGPWICARSCDAVENPCRDGYLCEDHICMPLCTEAAHCVETGYCRYDTGLCSTEPTEVCSGGVDDDGDGLADCEDTECMFRTECVEASSLNGGDTCAEAVEIPLPGGERGTVVVNGTTAGAGDDLTPGCELMDSADVVYSLTLTGQALAKVDLLGGRIEPRIQDTILALREVCEGPDLACNSDIEEGVYIHSFFEISLEAGTYYIIVDGFDGRTGDFTLGVNLQDP